MIGNNKESEIFNFETKTWRPMSSSPIPINTWLPCIVTWRDSFIIFGGSVETAVQVYNIATQVNNSFLLDP